MNKKMIVSTLLASAAFASNDVKASPALKAPDSGPILVAFVLSEGAVMIDFAGPWEVFQDASTKGSAGFRMYTVAATRKKLRVSGGMQVIPDYTFATAPAPRIVVIPAQHGFKDPKQRAEMLEWLRKTSQSNDLTMSVCNGVFTLAATGLLDGKSAAAFHDSWKQFEATYPNVKLERGARFVDEGKLASAGGLSSGIDLALHVVERYFGREAAEQTAFEMEYQGAGWKDPNSNSAYVAAMAAKESKALADGAKIDPVCGMTVDDKEAPTSMYQGKAYAFCSREDKAEFDAHPERYLKR